MKNKKIFNKTLIFTLLITFIFSSLVFAYNEAPILQEKVEKGDLPPLEERLPDQPLEIEPWHETGEYGGTWKRLTTSEEWDFIRMVMYGQSLIRYIKDGTELAPNILTDWEPNEDRTSWTLHLRKGLKWSDGELVTVDDIIFWWREMALNDEHTEYIPHWTKVDGEPMELTKIDDYTLKAEFKNSNRYLPQGLALWTNLGHGAYCIVPSHYLKQFHPEYNDEYSNFETFEEKQEFWHNTDCPVLTAWEIVEEKPGDSLILERNPYYYAVDDEGNQLPYIDKIEVSYLSDNEVFKLKMSNGESDMQIRPGALTIPDLSLMKNKEEENNFKTLLWDSGSGTGPLVYPNYTHANPQKRELYQNTKFRRALSYAIDRDQIQKMIYYDMGFKTTGTFSPKTPDYHKSNESEELYEKWTNLAVEFDLEKSKNLLDEIDVVDTNNDGWREMPNGDSLTLRIDVDSESPNHYTDSSEMIKETWEEIGLETIINTADGSQIQVMQTNSDIDIRDSWEIGGVSSLTLYPHWLVPVDSSRWAPLYGAWYAEHGLSREGTETDKDPLERTPPRMKPPEDGPIYRLQELLEKSKVATTAEETEKYVNEMMRIHVEEGPFIIGTVADYPRIGVVKNYMKNVPSKEELEQGGWVNPWNIPYPALTNPCQYYLDK